MHVRFLLAVAVCLALAPAPAGAQRKRKPKVVRIGVVIDGPWANNEKVAGVIRGEVTSLLTGEFDVQFPDEAQRVADWTTEGVKKNIDELLADPQIDIVYGMGVMASHDLGRRDKLPKPVIAAFVIDPGVQGIPLKKGTSGVKNLTYLTSPWTLGRDIQALSEIARADKITFLGSKRFIDAIDGLDERVAEAAKEHGVDMSVVGVDESVDAALAAISKDSQAVLVGPLLHLTEQQLDAVIAGINAKKLPSFSIIGRAEVERGMLAGIRPLADFNLTGRRLALNTQRILLGEDAGTLPVTLQYGEDLVINMSTARAIGHYPSWAVLTEAELINPVRQNVDRKLTLASAVAESQKANVDLSVDAEEVAAGREDIRRARSVLLPQLDFTTSARVIDAKTADASFGSASEFLWDAEASVTQVLWSERAWAGLDIEKSVQRTREHGLAVTRLDVGLDAGVAYLNVLRAKTLERIQRENLKVTRSNLDLSRTRERIGTGNPAEVYRWESQIANDRKGVISASANRNVAEIALNRVLHRPAEESFETEETAIDDPALLTSHDRLFTYFADPGTFKLFRKFLVARAVERSPELAQLSASISAQERVVASNRRAFYSPTLALRGGVTADVVKAGAGSDGPDLPLPPNTMLAEAPKVGWFVAVSLSIPLFTSGERSADLQKAKIDLRRFGLQHEAVRERIEQRMASAMHLAGASFAAIKLSDDSATAAHKNLELVTDAYAKGTVSILELLDAQNASLVADQLAANAVFDFLVDWMNVQRASGQLDLLMTDAERKDFFEAADAFIAQARGK